MNSYTPPLTIKDTMLLPNTNEKAISTLVAILSVQLQLQFQYRTLHSDSNLIFTLMLKFKLELIPNYNLMNAEGFQFFWLSSGLVTFVADKYDKW